MLTGQSELNIKGNGLQDLMREAPVVTNVVEACTLSGRQERLDDLLEQMELCEKALQVLVALGLTHPMPEIPEIPVV